MGRSNALRRGADVALTLLSAPVWVPLTAITAVAVLVSSGRPVFFCQTRTGRHGTLFTMFKFRSMTTGPNPLIPDADHITRIGAVLRRTSLDELPQLVNVLRGEMSLVGPRPMLPEQSRFLSPEHSERHSVRPGMTGLAQISGRNTLAWFERIELDRQWVRNASLVSYLGILYRTIAVVLGTNGVDGHPTADPFVDLTLVPTIDLEETTSNDPTYEQRAAS